ncbi:hypothetical protein MASR1M60_24980 [Rhodocyclaceae bacterium]
MKRLLLLCFALVLTQLALAGHGIEHVFHEHDEACVECLVLPGMQGMPARIQTPPALRMDGTPTCIAVPPAPTFTQYLSFHSRAPPLPQSR